MPGQIGKYELVERIGRGGMGMVYKGHDPGLHRAVAIKVISPDVEITDDLRARFFREAQACARLNHPNIVTVYDMGEQDGRLFMVMELLDGDELRRVISQHKQLPLEDKLSIITQICDGLHYAHRQGIVHRDIKPGNIFLLRSGQVKILDFGIAQMTTTTGGLTRTGLIMGTLRYIAPEQVLGRATARSDVYSVGAVFYELLALRPPFHGEDPIQLLAQLRSEQPTPLAQLDPSIPPELVDIVDRAMRKDPNDRYGDLAEMRSRIDVVQRGLLQEAQQLRAHLREELDEIFRLQRSVAEHMGTLPEEVRLPPIDDQGRVAAMRAIEHDFATRRAVLQDKLAQAESVAPALRRGHELLQALQFDDAVLEFEAVLVDMPDHARAQEALRHAQAQADVQRRQQLSSKLVADARTAYDDASYALCLEILKEAADVSAQGSVVKDIAALRQLAQAAFETQEAARHDRERADLARESMTRARRHARRQDAARYASDLWQQAESRAEEAQGQYAHEAYAQAVSTFESAASTYAEAERTAKSTREREREAAGQAQIQMDQRRRDAETAGAPQYAHDVWVAAEARAADARRTVDTGALADAITAFNEAASLYVQGAEIARREQDKRRATEASDRAKRSRHAASAAGAEEDAAARWSEAGAALMAGDAALQQGSYASAIEAFTAAEALYQRAESEVADTRRRQRSEAEHRREAVRDARRSAVAAQASALADALWAQAEAASAAGEQAYATAAFVSAAQGFQQAANLYRQAAEAAADVTRRREKDRTDAEHARDAAAAARRTAADSQASQHAAKPWTEAESAEERARAALSRQDYKSARTSFTEARRLYASAAQSAVIAADLLGRRVEAMMRDAQRLLDSKDPAGCVRRVNEVLAIRPGHGPAEDLGRQAEALLHELEVAASAPDTTIMQVLDPRAAETIRIEAAVVPAPPQKGSEPPRATPAPPGPAKSPDTLKSGDPAPRQVSERTGQTEDDDADVTVFALPRVDARSRSAPAKSAPTEDDDADVTIVAVPRDGRGQQPRVPASAGVAQRPADRPSTAEPRRVSPRVMALALGLALLVIAAVLFFYWLGQPATSAPRRSSPGAVHLTQLRAATDLMGASPRDDGTGARASSRHGGARSDHVAMPAMPGLDGVSPLG